MNRFALFGNRESGHAYKVRLMLSVSAIHYQYEEVDLALPHGERPEPFRSLSKFGEVPLLVHAGVPYVQSNAILTHLAEHTRAFGGDSRERLARVREWLFWESNRIGFSLPNLRHGRKFTPGGLAPDVERMLRARFEADIARIEQELSDGRAFILDDAASIADLSLCGYMFWPEQAGVTLPARVRDWLHRIGTLPGWRHPYDFPD